MYQDILKRGVFLDVVELIFIRASHNTGREQLVADDFWLLQRNMRSLIIEPLNETNTLVVITNLQISAAEWTLTEKSIVYVEGPWLKEVYNQLDLKFLFLYSKARKNLFLSIMKT